jgi:hypothetical protein
LNEIINKNNLPAVCCSAGTFVKEKKKQQKKTTTKNKTKTFCFLRTRLKVLIVLFL